MDTIQSESFSKMIYYDFFPHLRLNHKIILKLRHLYGVIYHPPKPNVPPSLSDKDKIQQIIYAKIVEGKPLMVARIGSVECDVLENIKYTFFEKRSNLKFICWKGQPNFLNPFLIPRFGMNAGFFPIDDIGALKRFYQLMLGNMLQVDILGSWLPNEVYFSKELKSAIKIDRERMTPLLTKNPWTKALEGKNVLVVSPFAESIRKQYERRELLFPDDPNILPCFNLKVLKAVQTAGGGDIGFEDWFDALKYMEDEIDKSDYDVALLGCGAYGFPLAAHCKEMGKQAIHLGGVLQLLFGIKGKRWETDPGYIHIHPYLPTYCNEYWIRPSEDETPKGSAEVENNCYW